MDERAYNLLQIECRKDANDLIVYSLTHDRPRDEKPGQFFNKIKHRLNHPGKLKVEHFRYPFK
jgi:hypothetical protein